jgi:hypothetical protein
VAFSPPPPGLVNQRARLQTVFARFGYRITFVGGFIDPVSGGEALTRD